MKFLQRLTLPILLFVGSTPALATDFVACVVADGIQGNPTYFGLATTVTRLKCEFTKPDFYPTLAELYQRGWRLIEVVGGDHALSLGNRGPSPLYLLEREGAPAPAAAAEQKKPKEADKGSSKKKK